MRRIIFDVPLWSLYLHRAARGLPRADPSDAVERALEDELFERLYAGEAEPMPEAQRTSPLADWAKRIHDTIAQLPAFERLAQDCRGRADEAAMAVEALMNELRPDETADVLRRSIRAGCGKAMEAVEQLRDALDGLEHVGFGTSPPGTPGTGEPARSLAARLRDDARLRRIAQLAGRFRRIAGGKRRSRVRHGADEMVDIEQGANMGRLLPLELAQLVHPRTRLLTLRNMVELLCLQYRLEGKETLGKGPLVVAIDKSGSMEGDKDIWATAVALALLDVARHEKRPFALLCFDGAVKHESIVLPGAALPEAALFVPADGGTDIDKAVRRSLEIIEQRPGALREADVVLVTDGGSDPAGAPELRERAAKLGVTVLGIAIDVEPSRLEPWCDEVIAAHDMSRVDERAADALFRR
jgi:VWA domain-containing protein